MGKALMRVNAILTRVVHMLAVIFGSTLIVSLLLQLLPVGLKDLYIAPGDEASVQAQLKSLGLDGNAFTFYWHWLSEFVHGNFGYIIFPGGGREPVSNRLATALPISLRIVFYVQILSLLISIPLGIFTAYRAGRKSDKAISYGLFAASSIPNFVFGLLLAIVIGVKLGWLPPLGYVAPSESFTEHIKTIILPVVSLAIPTIATYTRLLRSDVIATLREDYVTMAASKGLSNRRILFTHVLRPSSTSLFTSAALNMGALIGGTLVIEQIFSIPGMGTEIAIAIFSRQFFALQSYIAIIAVGYVLFNGIIDVLLGFVDPRTRERRNA